MVHDLAAHRAERDRQRLASTVSIVARDADPQTTHDVTDLLDRLDRGELDVQQTIHLAAAMQARQQRARDAA